jgi:MSHA biogenesis protein MshP
MRPEAPCNRARQQAGFALVAAMFVMIIIALVILAMTRLAGNQHGTNSLAIQQARAYQAARAGLEWGITRAVAGNCAASSTVNMAGSNLSEFTVSLRCTPLGYNDENGTALNIYTLTASAQNGVPASRPDYAFRRLTAKVEMP